MVLMDEKLSIKIKTFNQVWEERFKEEKNVSMNLKPTLLDKISEKFKFDTLKAIKKH